MRGTFPFSSSGRDNPCETVLIRSVANRLRRHCLAFLALAAAGMSSAQTLDWSNASGGNWSTPANWLPAGPHPVGGTARFAVANTFNVTGSGSEWTVNNNLRVGVTGTLNVLNGGKVTATTGPRRMMRLPITLAPWR